MKKRRANPVLGLSFDAGRLEGVVLRRTNGSVEVRKTFAAPLTLDPLKDAAELVGREIRHHLEQAGIRERHCAVCLPLDWALCVQTDLPELPDEDLDSFLDIEAERAFPHAPDALCLARSQVRLGTERYATQVAMPRDHIARLENALKAARLIPVTFSLGITALQDPTADSSNGVVALAIGEKNVSLQISSGGGVAALRTMESGFDAESPDKRLYADVIAREIRVTLGQLPPETRRTIRRLRVIGHGEIADRFVEEIGPRAGAMDLKVEHATRHDPEALGIHLPENAGFSPAFALAARYLAGRNPGFEFLPPKLSPWQQINQKYSSRKVVWSGAAAGAVALAVIGAFGVQQWQLSRLESSWKTMEPAVNQLKSVQADIRKFRGWYDESFGSMRILREVTRAFPEDGAVTAKSLEIRNLSTVACSGVTRDDQDLYRALDRLREVKQVSRVNLVSLSGQKPRQFIFNFQWGMGGGNEN